MSTPDDPMPELCHHESYFECTAECHEKAKKWDEWLKRWIKAGDTEAPCSRS